MNGTYKDMGYSMVQQNAKEAFGTKTVTKDIQQRKNIKAL